MGPSVKFEESLKATSYILRLLYRSVNLAVGISHLSLIIWTSFCRSIYSSTVSSQILELMYTMKWSTAQFEKIQYTKVYDHHQQSFSFSCTMAKLLFLLWEGIGGVVITPFLPSYKPSPFSARLRARGMSMMGLLGMELSPEEGLSAATALFSSCLARRITYSSNTMATNICNKKTRAGELNSVPRRKRTLADFLLRTFFTDFFLLCFSLLIFVGYRECKIIISDWTLFLVFDRISTLKI